VTVISTMVHRSTTMPRPCGGRTSTSNSQRYSMSMIPSFPTAPLSQDLFRCAPTLLLQTPCIGKLSCSTTTNRTAWASTAFSVTNPQLVERLLSLSIMSMSIFQKTARSPRCTVTLLSSSVTRFDFDETLRCSSPRTNLMKLRSLFTDLYHRHHKMSGRTDDVA